MLSSREEEGHSLSGRTTKEKPFFAVTLNKGPDLGTIFF